MAADGEEIVMDRETVAPEHFRPERGDLLLERIARSGATVAGGLCVGLGEFRDVELAVCIQWQCL